LLLEHIYVSQFSHYVILIVTMRLLSNFTSWGMIKSAIKTSVGEQANSNSIITRNVQKKKGIGKSTPKIILLNRAVQNNK